MEQGQRSRGELGVSALLPGLPLARYLELLASEPPKQVVLGERPLLSGSYHTHRREKPGGVG